MNWKIVKLLKSAEEDKIVKEFIEELLKPRLLECSIKKKLDPKDKDCFVTNNNIRK